jgi:hypothetical protein
MNGLFSVTRPLEGIDEAGTLQNSFPAPFPSFGRFPKIQAPLRDSPSVAVSFEGERISEALVDSGRINGTITSGRSTRPAAWLFVTCLIFDNLVAIAVTSPFSISALG